MHVIWFPDNDKNIVIVLHINFDDEINLSADYAIKMVDQLMRFSTLSTGDEEMVKSLQKLKLQNLHLQDRKINQVKQMFIRNFFRK